MVQIQWWNGTEWIDVGEPWANEDWAWASLGGDNNNYRIINLLTKEILMGSYARSAICAECGHRLLLKELFYELPNGKWWCEECWEKNHSRPTPEALELLREIAFKKSEGAD